MKPDPNYREWSDDKGPSGKLIGILLVMALAGAATVVWNWDAIVNALLP